MMIAPFSLLPLLAATPTVEVPLPQTPDATPVEASEGEKTGEWEGSIAVSSSFSDGNTDVTNSSVTADGIRETDEDRWTLGFSWAYTEDNGMLTQRRTFARGQYDYFLDEKSYLLADSSVQANGPAGLDLRTSVGAGYGYQALDDDSVKLGLEAGIAYIDQDLTGQPGNDFIAARAGYDLQWQMTDDTEFEQHMKVYPSLEESEDVFGQLDTRVKMSLTEAMFAQFQWIFDWNNNPAAGRKRTDNLFLITLGWSF